MASSSSPIVSGTCLWAPTQAQLDKADVTDFAAFVRAKTQFNWHQDFNSLWQWSVDHMPEFWDLLWDWHGIIGDKGGRILANPNKMPGAEFFPGAQINFAENLLADADDRLAISAHGEDGRITRLTRKELKQQVLALAGWLQDHGVTPGERVAAYTPNCAEAVITMLATASLG